MNATFQDIVKIQFTSGCSLAIWTRMRGQDIDGFPAEVVECHAVQGAWVAEVKRALDDVPELGLVPASNPVLTIIDADRPIL